MTRSPDGRRSGAADPPRPDASFARFLVVGGGCTGFQYALLAGLVEGFDWRPALASAVSYAAAAVLNYELTRRFTFRGRTASLRSFLRFAAVSGTALAANVAIFESALRLGAPHYLLAQAIATAIVTFGTWTAYRLWAFRH